MQRRLADDIKDQSCRGISCLTLMGAVSNWLTTDRDPKCESRIEHVAHRLQCSALHMRFNSGLWRLGGPAEGSDRVHARGADGAGYFVGVCHGAADGEAVPHYTGVRPRGSGAR